MRFLSVVLGLFLSWGLFAQTARINFFSSEVSKPTHTETLEIYTKVSSLFGANWVAPGLAIGLDGPLQKYFRLGGEVASYYQARTAILDLSLTARPVYQIGLAEGEGFLTAYVQLSAGPSMIFNSPINWGYHVGIVPGIRYIFEQHWGIFAELGYSFHALIISDRPNQNIMGGVFSFGVTYDF